MLLEGLHIPLTTPFFPDGRLALHKLAANVVRYSKSPAAGLIVLAPSGEPTLLADDETRDVLCTVAEAATPDKVLIAGISCDSVHATLALANYASEQNYDAILIAPPAIPLSESELALHFQSIADRSPLPIVLLSTAARTLSIEQIATLARHQNIIGLHTDAPATQLQDTLSRIGHVRRDVAVTSIFAAVTRRMQRIANSANASNLQATFVSTASLARNPAAAATAVAPPPASAPTIKTRTRTIGFQIIAAHAPSLLNALRTGATAIASPLAASAPQATYEIYAAWKDGDAVLADEKQARIIAAAHVAEASPSALKFACDLNGYFGGQPRLPHLPLTGEQRTAIEQLMQPMRN